MSAVILQSTGVVAGGTVTTSFTGVIAGSTIVVFSINVQTLSDDQNGGYGTSLASVVATDGSVEEVRVFLNSAGGTLNFTGLLYGGSLGGAIVALEVGSARISAYTPVAVAVHTSPGMGTDAQTTGNLTPSGAPALVIGFGLDVSTYVAAPATGTGFTSAGTYLNNGAGNTANVESLHVSSTTPIPVTFTATNGGGDSVTMGVVIEDFVAAAVFASRRTLLGVGI